jgi:hypothetical protein
VDPFPETDYFTTFLMIIEFRRSAVEGASEEIVGKA